MIKKSILRLGIERGLIEFKIVVKDPQTIIWTLFIFAIFILVLWLQRGTEINGVSLALLTLPGLLGMQIASSGFSDVASGIAFEKEDGTLLRAKAIPRGILAYFVAKIVGTFLMTFIYLIALFVMGLIVVPDVIGSINAAHIPLLLLYIFLGLLATAPFGAVLGSIVKTSGSGWGLSLAPLMILVAISGIFYPITALWGWVQVVAQVFPVYWLGLGFRSIFSPEAAAALEIGGSWRAWETIAVLVAWAIVGFILAPRIIRKMTRRVSGGEIEAARQRSIQRGY
jgi:ABC-2 type transport system permease protein